MISRNVWISCNKTFFFLFGKILFYKGHWIYVFTQNEPNIIAYIMYCMYILVKNVFIMDSGCLWRSFSPVATSHIPFLEVPLLKRQNFYNRILYFVIVFLCSLSTIRLQALTCMGVPTTYYYICIKSRTIVQFAGKNRFLFVYFSFILSSYIFFNFYIKYIFFFIHLSCIFLSLFLSFYSLLFLPLPPFFLLLFFLLHLSESDFTVTFFRL